MLSAISKTPEGTITLTVTLPWTEVNALYQKITGELVQEIEVKGFRKGKAPRELAEKELDRNKVYEEVIKHLIPEAYAKAVGEHKITPIIQPDIRLVKAKEGEDWQFTAQTCEKPTIDLGNWREVVKKGRDEAKKADIWLPGQDKQKTEEPSPEAVKQEKLRAIIEALLKEVKLTVPPVILESEVNKRLSQLLDEVQKLGMTIDQYLKSRNKTTESLRREYEAEIAESYKLEFILEEIADAEKVVVAAEEVDKLVKSAKTPEEQKALETQKYYLTTILRRQKTLDRLLSL